MGPIDVDPVEETIRVRLVPAGEAVVVAHQDPIRKKIFAFHGRRSPDGVASLTGMPATSSTSQHGRRGHRG
jgi:hypothetical protein